MASIVDTETPDTDDVDIDATEVLSGPDTDNCSPVSHSSASPLVSSTTASDGITGTEAAAAANTDDTETEAACDGDTGDDADTEDTADTDGDGTVATNDVAAEAAAGTEAVTDAVAG